MKKILTCILFFTTIHIQAANRYDNLGGLMSVSSEPRSFFYIEQINDVWWFIDPGGKAFISKGVNHISYTADFSPALKYSPYAKTTQEKYGTQKEWATETAQRLRAWGFNTIGAWSNEIMRNQQIPYTVILNIASRAGGDWEKGVFPDVYSSKFRQAARHLAQTQCQKRRDDIYLLGYFTDNELRWGPDWRSQESLLISYLKFKPKTDGNEKAIEFLNERYPDIKAFNQAWGIDVESYDQVTQLKEIPKSQKRQDDEDAFQEQIARQYFIICRDAIKKYDPNHLILGCRFAGYAPKPVLLGMKDSVDAISYNSYSYRPPDNLLKRIYDITGKPILIGEFSFKAMDSGLPNTKGAGKAVKTQKDRAAGFTGYVSDLMKLPYMIGYHWFEYTDEPAEGRFDGENSNYGVVNIKDEPWEILTEEMTRTNNTIENIHLKNDQ